MRLLQGCLSSVVSRNSKEKALEDKGELFTDTSTSEREFLKLGIKQSLIKVIMDVGAPEDAIGRKSGLSNLLAGLSRTEFNHF